MDFDIPQPQGMRKVGDFQFEILNSLTDGDFPAYRITGTRLGTLHCGVPTIFH